MPDPDRDALLKDMAANRGCKLVKSRKRTPGSGDFGRYGLKDAASDREVFGFGKAGLLTATPDEIEAWLRKGAMSDWKSSLAAAGSAAAPANDERTRVAKAAPKAKAKQSAAPAPRPKPKLRVVKKPPPPPPPPKSRPAVKIRQAGRADAAGLSTLLKDAPAKGLAARIAALGVAGTPPLVAEEDGTLFGVCAFHALPRLDDDAPLGRITLLLVVPEARRRGHGRALAEAAAARLADLGCTRIEAMAEIELGAAPDFFRRLGWSRSAYRYTREVGGS
jgi:N-acetylglutamate synthase-like GNAT family acetyltransferase